MKLNLNSNVSGKVFRSLAFRLEPFEVEFDPLTQETVKHSHRVFQKELNTKKPIYGVNTGFGVNGNRLVDHSELSELQNNLVSYLLCGTGKQLPVEVCRGTLIARTISLSKGYSGVSPELIDRLIHFINHDWIPVIPSNGSLGASGDLIPLAYIADGIQGGGSVYHDGRIVPTASLFQKHQIQPYSFKPKEALAIVNGTSAMVGAAHILLHQVFFFVEMSLTYTSWLALALGGQESPFSELVNSTAKNHPGQSLAARVLRQILSEEDPARLNATFSLHQEGEQSLPRPIQDRYSLRCVPQVLGPIIETAQLCEKWFERELNGVSDNPLVNPKGGLANGGNFYGGHISHGVDYLKICLAQLADLMDRQMMLLFDEKTSAGLPANLVKASASSHGLKGLHQSMSAITSQIIADSHPVGIHSRSSESHNQDKVSLGMSSCLSAMRLVEPMYEILSLYGVALAQALDLQNVSLRGNHSKTVYQNIRQSCDFLTKDRRMDGALAQVQNDLKLSAIGGKLSYVETL